MAKDINKILDDAVVPEMEYQPGEKHSASNVGATIDDIPEFELPKTKAEVYREAKDRLSEETAAASGAYKKAGRKKRVVQKSETDAQSTVAVPPLAEPVWVGDAEEIVPFAWRKPLIADIKRPSKYYKRAIKETGETRVPALRDNRK